MVGCRNCTDSVMVPALVQEEGQPGILSAMTHSSAVPDQEPQGEAGKAGEGIQIW